MKHGFLWVVSAAIIFQVFAAAQPARAADRHPDLSGIWAFAIDLPPVALKKVVNGKVLIEKLDQSSRRPAKVPVSGELPSTPAPSTPPRPHRRWSC